MAVTVIYEWRHAHIAAYDHAGFRGVEWRTKIIGFGADGAAVMLGIDIAVWLHC